VYAARTTIAWTDVDGGAPTAVTQDHGTATPLTELARTFATSNWRTGEYEHAERTTELAPGVGWHTVEVVETDTRKSTSLRRDGGYGRHVAQSTLGEIAGDHDAIIDGRTTIPPQVTRRALFMGQFTAHRPCVVSSLGGAANLVAWVGNTEVLNLSIVGTDAEELGEFLGDFGSELDTMTVARVYTVRPDVPSAITCPALEINTHVIERLLRSPTYVWTAPESDEGTDPDDVLRGRVKRVFTRDGGRAGIEYRDLGGRRLGRAAAREARAHEAVAATHAGSPTGPVEKVEAAASARARADDAHLEAARLAAPAAHVELVPPADGEGRSGMTGMREAITIFLENLHALFYLAAPSHRLSLGARLGKWGHGVELVHLRSNTVAPSAIFPLAVEYATRRPAFTAAVREATALLRFMWPGTFRDGIAVPNSGIPTYTHRDDTDVETGESESESDGETRTGWGPRSPTALRADAAERRRASRQGGGGGAGTKRRK
jgi:hypothetical protein